MLILASLGALAIAALILLIWTAAAWRRSVDGMLAEGMVWSAHQARGESSALANSIAGLEIGAEGSSLGQVLTDYDVLYSRAGLITDGLHDSQLRISGDVRAQGADIAGKILALSPAFDAMRQSGRYDAEGLRHLFASLVGIRDNATEMANVVRAESVAAEVEARSDVTRFTISIGIAIGLVVAAMLALMLQQWRRIRELSEREARLEVLGAERLAALHAAEAGNRAKSAFLASMSHEIRTPLNAVVGLGDLIAELPLPSEAARQVGIFHAAGLHLLGVISDIVDFSRLESGEIDIAAAPTSLAETAASVRAATEVSAQAKGLVLVIDMPALTFVTDPARLRQVLVNLTTTTIRSTASGGVRLAARPVEDGARVLFEVGDVARAAHALRSGQTSEDLGRLEMPGVPGVEDSGIGFAICRRLVTALGGEIAGLAPQGDEGSFFWFTLPATGLSVTREDEAGTPPAGGFPAPAPTATATATGHGGADAGAPAQSLRRPRALVVEDNPTSQEIARLMLERAGFTVDIAPDGVAARDRTAASTYDIVLMDLNMPGDDGATVTRKLRAAGVASPIVALTANVLPSDRARCLEAGMDDFLSKPVSFGQMLEMLNRWLPVPRDPKQSAGPRA